VSDYGVYNVVGGMVAMFSMLSGAMSSASQRFITFALGKKDLEHLCKVFNTSISLHVVLGFFLIVLLEGIGVWFLYNKLNIPSERLEIAFWVLQCSIVAFFIGIISVPFNAAIVAHEKMSAFAYIGIIDGILKLFIALLLLHAPIDRLLLYAFLLLLVTLLTFLIYFIYCRWNFVEARGIKWLIERQLFREMFNFAGWNLFGSGSLVLRNQGIDILLNLFYGVTVNAAKGVCNQIQAGVYQFVTNFQTAVVPQITKSVAQNNYERAHFLIMYGGRFSFYLLTLFAVPIIIVTHQLLSLWLVEVPQYTVEFVRWTMIYLLWDSLSRFLISSIFAYGRIKKYEIVVGGTKLFALPMAYVWLLLEGSAMVGVWVNIIIEMICLGQRLGFNAKYIGLSWRKYMLEVVIRCWITFSLAFILCYAAQKYVTDNFILILIISFVISFTTISIIGVSQIERKQVLDKAKAVLKKKLL
jgi:O-antigen/teichoic acid export membrane protein